MSVTAKYTSKLRVVEALGDASVATDDNTVTHDLMDVAETSFTAITSVPCTKVAAGKKALSSGTGTLDLRAIPGTNGATIDGNGLKVQLVKLKNKTGNANAMTITFGASNPYNLLGATFVVTLQPGQEILINLNEAAPDIDATHKTIDISGTGSQVLQYKIVMG